MKTHALALALAACAAACAAACDDGDADATADATVDAITDADPIIDADPIADAGPEDTGPPPPAPFEAAALVGTWTGVDCEPTFGEYLSRQITFTETDYLVFGTVFDDRDCTVVMSDFQQRGTWEITGGSRLGPDVAEVTFRLEENLWTVRQEGLLPGFDINMCGSEMWQVNVPQDIAETGCLGFVYARADCPDGEQEVVRLDGDRIATGARSGDICAERAAAVGEATLVRAPDAVTIDAPAFYPEGVAVGPDRALYVGAFTTGEIRRAALGEATAETLVPPGALGGAALGLKVHDGLLWACMTDLAAPENSALVHLDPATGAERARFPLPGGGICNDIAFAEDGTAYVTESSQNGVLRLPPGGEALEAWFTGDALPPVGGMGFGFNGLIVDADGSVLVGRIDDGTLTRIPVLEDGGAGEPAIEVIEPADVAFGIDGMACWRSGYYAVRGLEVVRLHPGDPWTSEVIATGDDFPATLAIDRHGNVWTTESKFGLLFDGDDATEAEPPFRVLRHPLAR